jgi:hypothetical protein
MADFNIVDGLVAGSLLLFTGTETAVDTSGSALELISKFGVIAVLWFWLRDMRKQIAEQTIKSDARHDKLIETFKIETDELRDNYDKIIDKMTQEYHTYSNKIEEILKEQRTDMRNINDRLHEIHDKRVNASHEPNAQ